jgi:hypothetical protein
MIGLVAIMAIYLGIGTLVIFDIAAGVTIPELTGLYRYFLIGLALFVPYSINQVRSAFDFLSK